MTGRHSGLGWPGAIGDQAREATAPPYIGVRRRVAIVGDLADEPVRKAVRDAFRDMYTRADPRRCLSCGHLEDRCECPHDCTYPEDTDAV